PPHDWICIGRATGPICATLCRCAFSGLIGPSRVPEPGSPVLPACKSCSRTRSSLSGGVACHLGRFTPPAPGLVVERLWGRAENRRRAGLVIVHRRQCLLYELALALFQRRADRQDDRSVAVRLGLLRTRLEREACGRDQFPLAAHDRALD